MFWEGVSALLEMFALWLGAAILFLVPLGIGLSLWHVAMSGLKSIGEAFKHVFTMHRPEEDEEDLVALPVEAEATATKDKQ